MDVSKPSFEEWLTIYPDHKYKTTTVSRYVRALQKAEEWFGIELTTPILACETLEDLQSIKAKILSLPLYEEVNRNHGHGDFSAAIALYEKYLSSLRAPKEEWWPSLKEYNPKVTKELWTLFLAESDLMPRSYLEVLAQIVSLGGSASCARLEKQFGKTFSYYRNILGTMAEKAVHFFNLPACGQKNAKYWPSMFLGRSNDGNYEYKIRPELEEALIEIDILKFLPSTKTIEFSLPDFFADRLSKRFITSLLAKPFVILTGNSGTGKTRIATRFARYMEVNLKDGKNFELVSVGADWTDNTAILGYYNPMGNEGRGEYNQTAILKLFMRARKNPDIPFFLILDEMNLSHVERYFADFLSHMETPDTGFCIDGFSSEEFTYPDNLFVIGTVNIDETTYMFSPKVLDRANVIEFKPDKESVLALFEKQSFTDSMEIADLQTIKAFMMLARKVRSDSYSLDLSNAKNVFEQVYDILEEQGFEFAYRTVKEICRYFYATNELSKKTGFDINESIDEQIVQKLLPKIYGNKRVIGDMLVKLEKLFDDEAGELHLSGEKIHMMLRKLDNTQYVSFI